MNAVGVFKEEIAVIEHGQLIVLGGGNQLPPIAQLDDAGHAGADDLVHIKGLGDKVRRPHLQGAQLRVLFGGEHDHGDAFEVLVFMYVGKHLKAVHFRHDQVQHDQRQLVLVFFDFLHGFLAVAGVNEFIIIFQNHPQHVAVDFLVVYDQHQLRSFEVLGLNHEIALLWRC